jgi:hypothetical protein
LAKQGPHISIAARDAFDARARRKDRLMQATKLHAPRDQARADLLYGQCRDLLRGLDESGMHHAAAHVSMALEVMRRTRGASND